MEEQKYKVTDKFVRVMIQVDLIEKCHSSMAKPENWGAN